MSDFPLIGKLIGADKRLTLLLSVAALLGLMLLIGLTGGDSEKTGWGLEEWVSQVEERMRLNKALPALEEETVALERASAAITARLLPDSNRALASAALQDRIKFALQSYKLGVKSIRMAEPEDAAGPFFRVAMSIEAFGNIESLMRFIHAVDAMRQPAVGVERLEIRKPDYQTPEVYNLRMELYAVGESIATER